MDVSKAKQKYVIKFNLPSIIPGINSIKGRSVNNDQQINEQYYIDDRYIARIQYSVFGGYNNVSRINYENKSHFIERVKGYRFYKSNLVGASVEEFGYGGDSGVIARKGKCYWLRLAKNTGERGVLTGRKNLLLEIASCRPLGVDPIDILKRIGRASEADNLNYALRTRTGDDEGAEIGSIFELLKTNNTPKPGGKKSFSDCFKNPASCE